MPLQHYVRDGGLSDDLAFLGIAVLVLIIGFMTHAFWKESDPMEQQMQMSHFMKNLTIDWRRLPLQLLVMGLFAAAIGHFSNQPPYQHLPDEQAVLKLSLRHAGQIVGECRARSPDELAGMPESMRAPLICPRERSRFAAALATLIDKGSRWLRANQ